MEEFLENLLFSALFPRVDAWRRQNRLDLPDPPDYVLRVFTRAETRLQMRYGFVELEAMVTRARVFGVARSVRRKLETMPSHDAWALLTRAAFRAVDPQPN